jgi:hypothetical protein
MLLAVLPHSLENVMLKLDLSALQSAYPAATVGGAGAEKDTFARFMTDKVMETGGNGLAIIPLESGTAPKVKRDGTVETVILAETQLSTFKTRVRRIVKGYTDKGKPHTPGIAHTRGKVITFSVVALPIGEALSDGNGGTAEYTEEDLDAFVTAVEKYRPGFVPAYNADETAVAVIAATLQDIPGWEPAD